MESLESELERARTLDVASLADAIETIGFECTRCGACCKAVECDDGADDVSDDAGGESREPHTATAFPDEIRQLQTTDDYDWRDVARPMPYGLDDGGSGPDSTGEDGGIDDESEVDSYDTGTGETFEWALATDDCGDCRFYQEDDPSNTGGTCTVYGDRPLVCRTYPFSVALGGTDQPMGEAVDSEGMVRAHECEGLGRDISRDEAEALAETLKERAIRSLEEAIAVRENYEPVDPSGVRGSVVVHDSEGAKRADGTPIDAEE